MAAVAGIFGAVGAAVTGAAATATVSVVVGGALVGAAVGALTSLVTGGDILKGALLGAVGGGIAGYGLTLLPEAGAAAGEVAAGGKAAGTVAAETGLTEGATLADASITEGLTSAGTSQVAEAEGLLASTGKGTAAAASSSAGGAAGMSWKEMMMAQGVLGAADSYMEGEAAKDQEEAESEDLKWRMGQDAPFIGDIMADVRGKTKKYDLNNAKSRFEMEMDNLYAEVRPAIQTPRVYAPTVEKPTVKPDQIFSRTAEA